jgi:hypothetical protein
VHEHERKIMNPLNGWLDSPGMVAHVGLVMYLSLGLAFCNFYSPRSDCIIPIFLSFFPSFLVVVIVDTIVLVRQLQLSPWPCSLHGIVKMQTAARVVENKLVTIALVTRPQASLVLCKHLVLSEWFSPCSCRLLCDLWFF